MSICLSRNDRWGNHYVATRDISAATVLLVERATVTAQTFITRKVVASLEEGRIGKTCVITRCANPACFAPIGTQTVECACATCRRTRYCSPSCREADASVHASECEEELIEVRAALCHT